MKPSVSWPVFAPFPRESVTFLDVSSRIDLGMGPVHAVGSMEIGIYRNLQNKPIYWYNNWGENGGKGRAYEKKILKISMKLRILQLPRKLQVSKFIIPFPSPIPKYFINSNQSLCCLYQYAADAAKSLQSCPTLCDPIDGSPPGSAVPGILQARTLEWVAISFSNAWNWKVKVKSLSRVRLLATPWTAAY